MPRGKRGTGPGARKRLQSDEEPNIKLWLTEEESRLVYEAIKVAPSRFGTREGALLMNVCVRIMEQTMLASVPNAKPKKGSTARSSRR
jgi:hypothetical protein